jgi:hypothetical protein
MQWTDGEDFLTQLAIKSGRLGKGGEPDLNTAAKGMLHDWQRGKIPFFTLPPDYVPDAAAADRADATDVIAPEGAVTVRYNTEVASPAVYLSPFLSATRRGGSWFGNGLEGGVTRLATGMLHDWQRGKILFFLLPPDYAPDATAADAADGSPRCRP